MLAIFTNVYNQICRITCLSFVRSSPVTSQLQIIALVRRVLGNISTTCELSVLWSGRRSLSRQTNGRTEERSELTEMETINSCHIAMLHSTMISGRWSVPGAVLTAQPNTLLSTSSAIHGR